MRRLLLALAAAFALAAPPAPAQEAPDRPGPAPVRDPLDRRDWGAEVRRMRAEERAELDALVRRAREAAPGMAQAQAERDLEQAKRQWRRRQLEAQLSRLRAAGRADEAARMELRLADLDAMARRRTPVLPGGAK